MKRALLFAMLTSCAAARPRPRVVVAPPPTEFEEMSVCLSEMEETMYRMMATAAMFVMACETPRPSVYPEGKTCAEACANLAAIGCEIGRPTPEGITCLELCEETTEKGVIWPTGCYVVAQDCSACDLEP